MEHLEQAVAKLEVMLHRARAAQCSIEEIDVLRAAQMLIIDALLAVSKRETGNVLRIRPMQRLVDRSATRREDSGG